MAEMVDKVAAALRDACLQRFGKAWEMPTAQQFAIVAIQAMRDPTMPMAETGFRSLGTPETQPAPDSGGDPDRKIRVLNYDNISIQVLWRDMIDAAQK